MLSDAESSGVPSSSTAARAAIYELDPPLGAFVDAFDPGCQLIERHLLVADTLRKIMGAILEDHPSGSDNG